MRRASTTRKLLLGGLAALALGHPGTVAAQTVGLGTMSQGTLSFSTGSVIAKVVKEAAGLEMRVQPNTGETIILPLVHQGALDFGIANVLEASDAYQGSHGFEGNALAGLRIAAVLYALRVAFFVRADSDVRTIADLAGKRVTFGFPAMGSTDRVAKSVLANGGLTEADIRPVLVPNVVKGAEQFLNERADAFFFAVGAAKVAEVHASVPLRMLSHDDTPSAMARMNAIFPNGYLALIQPLPNFAGVVEPSYALAYDNLLMTGAQVSDETVARVATVLAENKAALVAGFPLFRGFNPDTIVKAGMPVPFHPGVAAWYAKR